MPLLNLVALFLTFFPHFFSIFPLLFNLAPPFSLIFPFFNVFPSFFPCLFSLPFPLKSPLHPLFSFPIFPFSPIPFSPIFSFFSLISLPFLPQLLRDQRPLHADPAAHPDAAQVRPPKNASFLPKMALSSPKSPPFFPNPRSFYPLYPPSEELNVDFEALAAFAALPVTPDVLVTPSELRFFIKVRGTPKFQRDKNTGGAGRDPDHPKPADFGVWVGSGVPVWIWDTPDRCPLSPAGCPGLCLHQPRAPDQGPGRGHLRAAAAAEGQSWGQNQRQLWGHSWRESWGQNQERSWGQSRGQSQGHPPEQPLCGRPGREDLNSQLCLFPSHGCRTRNLG